MIRKLTVSKRDKQELASVIIDLSTQTDDFFDYRNVIIKKPWGHEYLVFQNENSAVWVLHMEQGHKTSMHCHPNKRTSLTVLAGEAKCSTLNSDFVVRAGEGLVIDKGVFHSTEAMEPEWVIVMEVETPTNKNDLIRLHDTYGRRGKRYEGQTHHVNHHNSICHFHGSEGRFFCSKKIGDCEVAVAKYNGSNLGKELSGFDSDLLSLIKGRVINAKKECIMEVGDTMWLDDLKNISDIHLDEEAEFLLIKKIK